MAVEETIKVDTTVNGQLIMRLVRTNLGKFIPYLRMTNGVHFQVAAPQNSEREGKRAGYEAVAARIGGKKISTKAISWELDYPVLRPITINTNQNNEQ